MTFIDYSLDPLRRPERKPAGHEIPTLYHSGGDWWFSAMERLWFFVAHYTRERDVMLYNAAIQCPLVTGGSGSTGKLLIYQNPDFPPEGGTGLRARWDPPQFFFSLHTTDPEESQPVATGGNPPKRGECAPYCKCMKHYSNIVPPKRPEET